MGVRGSFSELANLRDKVASLGTSQTRRALNTVLSEAAIKLIDDEFRESRDPYGNPWPTLVGREGQPLRDSGQLLNSLARDVRVNATGFSNTTNRKGAATHQYGATIRAKSGGVVEKVTRFASGRAQRVPVLRFKLNGRWVSKHKVVIPRRQYLPEGSLGSIWTKAFGDQAEDFLKERLGV